MLLLLLFLRVGGAWGLLQGRDAALVVLSRTTQMALVGKAPTTELEALVTEVADSRERKFARMLVSTCERRLGEIDGVLQQYYEDEELLWWRSLEKKVVFNASKKRSAKRATLTALRIGVAQLYFCDGVPARAAIHATVEAAKRGGGNAKVVNGVLRSVQRGAVPVASPEKNASPWILDMSALKEKETKRYLEIAALGPAPLDLSFKSVDDREKFLLRSNEEAQSSWRLLPCGSLRSMTSSGAFPEGDSFWAQDAAATAAASCLIVGSKKGGMVLDTCAAPGGKTAQLAASNHFGNIVAADVAPKRAKSLRANLARLGLDKQITVKREDSAANVSSSSREEEQLFDAVLVDAPCSCSGTARRRPEVLRKTSFGQLLDVQAALLDAGLAKLKPGGCLVYSTCSFLKPETQDQTEALLRRKPHDVERWPLDAPPTGFHPDALTDKGDIMLLPWHLLLPDDYLTGTSQEDKGKTALSDQHRYCDAHYIARFRKKQQPRIEETPVVP